MNKRLSSLVRKAVFKASGRIVLMDSVRNFAYQWSWHHLRNLRRGAPVLDIGSRSSPFPAFLAWRGFTVSIVEKDPRFSGVQSDICSRWQTSCEIITGDLLEIDEARAYEAICAIFSLQHAGDNDSPGYAKAGRLLLPGGLILAVNQYSPTVTSWHRGRDDGDLRIYGRDDLAERIERPLVESGAAILERRFASADFLRGRIRWTRHDDGDATVACIAARAKSPS